MTIAYIRTYSNKQQTESQKNAIEQFAKAKKIEIDKWLKDAKNSSKEKNRLEDVIKNLQEGDILIVADSFEDNVNSKTLAFTFTASKNKGTKLGRPLGSPKTEFLLSQKSQIERELKEENATYAELADYYKVSLSGFKRFIRENIPNLPSRRKKKNDTE